jgi:predicted dehydrogenase
LAKQFGFGLIGCGMVGQHHITAIGGVPGSELVAVCDVNEDAARSFGEDAGVPWFTDYGVMLREVADLDVVNVCTPSGLHLEPALACIRAGKHVVVEKPLEITLDRCDKLIQAAEKAGVEIATIFPSRFGDAAQELKKAIERGRFGTLTLGNAIVPWWRTQEYYDSGGWRGTWKLDGGGALMNQSIHNVDLIQWYMGSATAVTAIAGCLAHQRIEVEDTAIIAVEWANGAYGTIIGTTAAWPGAHKRIEIAGTDGTVVMEEDSLIKTWEFRKGRSNDSGIREQLAEGGHGTGASDPMAFSPENHRRQIHDFVKAIRKGGQPLVDGLEGRRSVEIILAAYKSAQTGKRVELPLSPRFKPGKGP